MRCLIVDDAATGRQVMEHLVRGAGSMATAVASGTDALAALAQDHYDVALVDHEMPAMNGVETIRALRRASPMLRILVVSAYHDAARVSAALAAGANGYLLKDEMLGSLVRFVDEVRAGNMPISPRVTAVILAAHERQLAMSERDAALGRMARRLLGELFDPVDLIDEQSKVCHETLTPDVLETLEFVYPDLDAVALRTALDVLQLGAGHLRALARDISALEAFDGSFGQSDVAQIIDLVTRVSGHAARGCVQIIVDAPPDLRVGVEPGRLCHVLLTLLGQAIETIRERYDGVGTVNIQARACDGWAVLEMSDDGRGLTALELDHAFDPLWSGRGKHRGVRLSGCRDLVSRAGGDIALASRIGEGTRVTLRLPLAAERGPGPRRKHRIAMGTGSHGVIGDEES